MSISFKIVQDRNNGLHLGVYHKGFLVKFFCGLSRFCVNDAIKAIKKDGLDAKLRGSYHCSDIYCIDNEYCEMVKSGVYVLRGGEIVGLVRDNFQLWDDLSVSYNKSDLKHLARVSNKL